VTRLLNKVYRRNDGNINSFKKTDLKLWGFGLVRCQSTIFDLFLKDPDRLSFPSPAWLLEAPFSTFQAVDDQFSSCGLPRFRSDSLEKETLEAKGDVPKKPMERGWEIPRTK
jgi:hypothetical protein